MIKIKNKKGFSFGEVMIATFILSFGIVSAVTLSTRSTGVIIDSRNSAIATSLSQEGVELIRNIRDNNITEFEIPNDSDSPHRRAFVGYDFPGSDTRCAVGYTIEGSDILKCGSGLKGELYVDEANGVYTHENISGGKLIFKRLIFIDYESSIGGPENLTEDNAVAEITSVVVWGKGVIPDTVAEVESDCRIDKKCVFSQTKLSSWINQDN